MNIGKATDKQRKALEQLVSTRKLTTAMLPDLGLSFEQFLQLSQLSDKQWNAAIDRLVVAMKKRYQ